MEFWASGGKEEIPRGLEIDKRVEEIAPAALAKCRVVAYYLMRDTNSTTHTHTLCTQTHTHKHTHACMHTHTHKHTQQHSLSLLNFSPYIHLHTHTNARTPACTHTHAHTHTATQSLSLPYMRLLFPDQFQRVCFVPVRCSVPDEAASSREPFCLCRFVKDGSTFVQALSLGSIQFCGFVRSAKLPPLSPNLKNPKPRVEVNMLTNETEEAPVSLAAGVQLLCVGFRGDVCLCVALSALNR